MIRIMFVDDDLNVLEAMQRTMRPMRHEWSMEFASSGAEALERLAKTVADVIVTDMCMPGMDGWQLLAEVKILYPQTVRLVLSGHADPGAIMRLVGTAHQYIAKPGETATLKAAIAQTQLLKRLLSSDRLAALVGSVGTLPSCPRAFQEISACLRQPNASAADAARIIGRDAAMTANLMKLVNSAFFGQRRPFSSVERALAYLGLDTVAALALGHSLFQNGGSSPPGGVNLENLWKHSLQTAMAARAIALVEKLPTARAEEAFMAGMLHDIGRVVYATRSCAKPGQPESSNEDTVEQVDRHHAEVGAYLLGLWGFPSHVVEAVALHHTPVLRADSGFDLTVLINIADRISHADGAISLEAAELGIEPGLLEGLGLSNHLPQWLAALAVLDSEQDAA
jgi:putative nucleotidyltransferase with HDIG domain